MVLIFALNLTQGCIQSDLPLQVQDRCMLIPVWDMRCPFQCHNSMCMVDNYWNMMAVHLWVRYCTFCMGELWSPAWHAVQSANKHQRMDSRVAWAIGAGVIRDSRNSKYHSVLFNKMLFQVSGWFDWKRQKRKLSIWQILFNWVVRFIYTFRIQRAVLVQKI